jgi:methionyl-tRNA synthetase
LERFNADLANALGNTASRTVTMVNRYLDGKTPAPSAEGPVPETAANSLERYTASMESLEPHRALEAAWQLIATINGFIQDTQPWALAKRGDETRTQLEATLYASLEGLRITSLMIEPVMPTIAARLRTQVGAAGLEANLLDSTTWGVLPAGSSIGEAEPLFPRVDVDAYISEAKKEGEKMPESDQNLLTIDEFARLELVVGTVREAEQVPKSKKLVRILVDIGEDEPRQIVAGIAERYEAAALVGRQIVVVTNLKPAKLMGVESRGMLLAATVNGDPILLGVDEEVPNGSRVS